MWASLFPRGLSFSVKLSPYRLPLPSQHSLRLTHTHTCMDRGIFWIFLRCMPALWQNGWHVFEARFCRTYRPWESCQEERGLRAGSWRSAEGERLFGDALNKHTQRCTQITQTGDSGDGALSCSLLTRALGPCYEMAPRLAEEERWEESGGCSSIVALQH